jgi:hypothetical protein
VNNVGFRRLCYVLHVIGDAAGYMVKTSQDKSVVRRGGQFDSLTASPRTKASCTATNLAEYLPVIVLLGRAGAAFLFMPFWGFRHPCAISSGEKHKYGTYQAISVKPQGVIDEEQCNCQ